MSVQSSPDGGDSRSAAPTGGGEDSALRRRIPEYLTVATIVAPFGLRGELKVRLETDFPDRFTPGLRLWLGPERIASVCEGFRQHKGMGLLKLQGCDDRSAAEALRSLDVQIPVAEAAPLPAGRYYEYQVLGLEVETVEGEALGRVEEVLHTGSNAVLVTQGPRGEVLIPVLEGVLLDVDHEAERLRVRLPPGLLD